MYKYEVRIGYGVLLLNLARGRGISASELVSEIEVTNLVHEHAMPEFVSNSTEYEVLSR